MRPLQDKCDPTPYEDLEGLFLSDMGVPVSQLFDNFDPEPIGVASLAQVHVGHHRESGKQVAVKVRFMLHIYILCFYLLSRCSCNIHTSPNFVTSIWRWSKSPSVSHSMKLVIQASYFVCRMDKILVPRI